MNQLDFNTRLLDNPYMMGVGSDNLINADGGDMFGQVEKFRIKRNIMRDDVVLFKIGEVVKGLHSGKGVIRVPLKPKHRVIFNRKGVRLLIGKDLTPLVSNAEGNDTDMLMGWALEEEVKSNATAITSPIPTKTATLAETVAPAPSTTLSSPAPSTTLSSPAPSTTLSSPAPSTTLSSPATAQKSTSIIATPIESAPVTTKSEAPTTTTTAPKSPSLTPETSIETDSSISKPTAPQATTIIAPAVLPATEVIAPIPQVVVPATEVLPTYQHSETPSGGGGGGFIGGSASKTSEGGGEAQKRSAQGVVVAPKEKKILGMKPVYFYSILGLAALAAGIYAYKKFKTA